MAKGTGWAMAAVLGGLKVAHLRGEVVICPICGGPMTVGIMTEQFKCRSSDRNEDMPDWLAEALRAQGYSPWAYYPQNGAIQVLAIAENGAELGPMRDRGNFGGWQWSEKPEGEIAFPEWFPIETCAAYIQERWAAWEVKLAELQNHPDAGGVEEDHPARMIQKLEANIARAEEIRQKQAKRESQRQADQAALDKALAEDGFFDGRIGKAVLPEGVIVIRRDSMGDRQNPYLLIAGPKLTVAQLRRLVEARGNYSEVVMEDRFPAIHTPDPKGWIGRQGCVAKHLARALGLKFLRVIEK